MNNDKHNDTRPLPAPFADLSTFVNDWALPSEQARFHKLHTTSLEELRRFYDAMLPRMDEILAYLNQYSLTAMPADAGTLFDLAITFAETAHPIDLKWDDVDFSNAYPWDKFEFRTVSTTRAFGVPRPD